MPEHWHRFAIVNRCCPTILAGSQQQRELSIVKKAILLAAIMAFVIHRARWVRNYPTDGVTNVIREELDGNHGIAFHRSRIGQQLLNRDPDRAELGSDRSALHGRSCLDNQLGRDVIKTPTKFYP